MTDPATSAEKLLARCFSVEELTWLLDKPQFLSAAHQMRTVEEALDVIDMGQKLIRTETEKTFKSPGSTPQPPPSQA